MARHRSKSPNTHPKKPKRDYPSPRAEYVYSPSPVTIENLSKKWKGVKGCTLGNLWEKLRKERWVDLGAGDGRIGLAVIERMRTFFELKGVPKGSDMWVPRPRLLLVEKDSSHQEAFQRRLHHRDEFLLQPLEECGGQVDKLLIRPDRFCLLKLYMEK